MAEEDLTLGSEEVANQILSDLGIELVKDYKGDIRQVEFHYSKVGPERVEEIPLTAFNLSKEQLNPRELSDKLQKDPLFTAVGVLRYMTKSSQGRWNEMNDPKYKKRYQDEKYHDLTSFIEYALQRSAAEDERKVIEENFEPGVSRTRILKDAQGRTIKEESMVVRKENRADIRTRRQYLHPGLHDAPSFEENPKYYEAPTPTSPLPPISLSGDAPPTGKLGK